MFAKESLHIIFTQAFLSHKILAQKNLRLFYTHKSQKFSQFNTKHSIQEYSYCPSMLPFCTGRQRGHSSPYSHLLLRQYHKPCVTKKSFFIFCNTEASAKLQKRWGNILTFISFTPPYGFALMLLLPEAQSYCIPPADKQTWKTPSHLPWFPSCSSPIQAQNTQELKGVWKGKRKRRK